MKIQKAKQYIAASIVQVIMVTLFFVFTVFAMKIEFAVLNPLIVLPIAGGVLTLINFVILMFIYKKVN